MPDSPTAMQARGGDADRAARARQTAALLAASDAVAGHDVLLLLRVDADDPVAVADALAHSPALASRVLATINAAAFGLSQRVRSIHQAVALLGAREARRLAVAQALLGLGQHRAVPPRLLKQWWSQSLVRAGFARQLAGPRGEAVADEAYTLALIQDIGMLGLMGVDAAFYAEHAALADRDSFLEAERERFGLDHCGAGRSLLIKWQAPREIWSVVRRHHEPPGRLGDQGDSLDAILYACALLPHLEEPVDDPTLRRLHELYRCIASDETASLQQCLEDAMQEAERLGAAVDAVALGLDTQRLTAMLTETLARDTVHAAAEVHRLRSNLEQHRGRIERLEQAAATDPLTGVANRRGFFDRLDARLADAARQPVAFLIADLDQFKAVNDRYGHAAGDAVLHAVAERLRETFGANAVVGRVGGDEFAVAVFGLDSPDIRRRLLDLTHDLRIQRPWMNGVAPFAFGLTVGGVHVPTFEPERMSVDELLRQADAAMYSRKNGRGDAVCLVPWREDQSSTNVPPSYRRGER